MSVKSNYFKMDKQDFEIYLNHLKDNAETIHIMDGSYFYYPSSDITNQIVELNKRMLELDSIIDSFSDFAKNQIVQSFLLSEIEATNKIENVYSTRHDIFSVISRASLSKDKKVISISKTYKQLLDSKGTKIETLEDIRKLYDIVMSGAIEDSDLPDGVYFRKKPVYVTNGIKTIHSGVLKEENINRYMTEFISLYNSNYESYIKMILCHYMFEHIHPFYDGNGRFGRFLFSNGLYLSTKSYFSFLISFSFGQEKSKYYKAFEEADDRYEFGCLNDYVETILKILLNQIEVKIHDLKMDKEKVDSVLIPYEMQKSEKMIYHLICEASIFSEFGVSNEEIMRETGLSKRTLMYCLDDLKTKNVIEDIKIGKYSFHRMKRD